MTFNIKKPTIVDINKQGMDNTKKDFTIFLKKRCVLFLFYFSWMFIPGILMIFMGDIAKGLLAIFSVFLFVLFVIYISSIDKARNSFWKQLASANGWKYESQGKRGLEKGIMFRQGDRAMENMGVSISNCVEGNIDNKDFRIFSFDLITGGSKRDRNIYEYTVFAFKFQGNFPHFYLNNKKNSFGVDIGNFISLPAEFDDKFLLAAPKEYEIEALEIFTPNILAVLLDRGFSYDIEFVNQEMLIFADGSIYDFADLEKKLNQTLELADMFRGKLDHFKFEKIGDLSPILKLDHSEKTLTKNRIIIVIFIFLGSWTFGALFFYLFELIRENAKYDFSSFFVPVTMVFFTFLFYFLDSWNRQR
jgi:hypothetical protein